MPVNLSIKNVPDEVVEGLRNRATRNQRSLHAEILYILKQAAKGQGAVSMDEVLDRAQRTRPGLDEAASRVEAAKEAEQREFVRRFEDLLSGPEED